MNCSIEEAGSFSRKLHIHVPAEDFDKQVNRRLRKISTTAKLKGFRPGKVPFEIIKQQYSHKVMQEVANDLMRESYIEALQQKSLEPISSPHFDDIKIAPGEGIKYTANIEVLPKLKLQTLKKVSIEKPTSEVTEENIDNMIERVRRNHGDWKVSDQPADNGDRLTIDLELQDSSATSANRQMEDISLVLGLDTLAPGFDKQLIGAQLNEERTVVVTFAKEYRQAELAGRTVSYKVLVKKIEQSVLPELDQTFFEACNIKEGGLETLRKLLREGMERELQIGLKKRARENIVNAMLERNPIEVPDNLLNERIDTMRENATSNLKTKEVFPDEIFREPAIRQIRLSIILRHFAEQRSLRVDRQEFEDKLNEFASIYEEADKLKDYYRSNRQAAQSIEAMAIEDKVVASLSEDADITEKHYDFYEIVDHKH